MSWGVLIVAILSVIAILEAHAISKNKTTLSRYVWSATKAFPPLPFIVGLVVGFLGCHFFWPICV